MNFTLPDFLLHATGMMFSLSVTSIIDPFAVGWFGGTVTTGVVLYLVRSRQRGKSQ